MIGVALKGLAGRKLRSALTMFAIILGVAMVSGTYVLTDTIDKAFSGIFQESYANTDVVVSGKSADISFQGDTTEPPPVPEETLAKVRAIPDVEAATGTVVDQTNTKLLTKKGKAVNTGGSPSFGFGIDPAEQRFNPLKLVEGTWPQTPGEVVLDAAAADEEGYKIGDTVKIATLLPVEEFKVVGLAQYGEVESLGTATFTVFTIPEAQRLLEREGQLDAISVAAKDGVTPEQLQSELREALGSSVTVRTGNQQASKDLESVEFTNFIRYFLLSFAGIALFVGAFVIFNTFSITVAQRTREFATLRTIGASRRQLMQSVVLEALVIGFVASLIGLFAGLGLAVGLNELFKALNLDLPTQGTVFATRTIVISMLIGVVVTLLAGVFPALRATRVPPIAAVREGATLPKSRFSPFVPYLAIAIIAIGVAALGLAMFKDELDTAPRLLAIAGGVLALFTGVAMVSSHVVRPLAVGVSPIAKWVTVLMSILIYPVTLSFWLVRYGAFSSHASASRRGLALLVGTLLALVTIPIVLAMWLRSRLGKFVPEWPLDFPGVLPDKQASILGRENSRRNPGRTASTAAALMIGVALVTFIAVLANGMKASNRGAIEDQVKADYVVTAQDGFSPFVTGAADALEKSPDADLVTSVRAELGKVAGEAQYVTGINPSDIAEGYVFEWEDGSNAVLQKQGLNGVILAKDFADKKNLEIGDNVKLLTPSDKTATLVVRGIYKPPPFFPLLGSASISQAAFDSLYERPRNSFVFVNTANEDPATTAGLEKAVANFPDAKVQTREAWIDQQDKDFNQFLILLYVLLTLSVVVSIFGMINTLVLTVFERTRELGMLRAVGMTRRQVRRMVRHESIITALIGAALGLPLGVFLAALVTRALSQFEVKFSIPGSQLAVFALVAVIVGIVAAIVPARRAAKLNVLRALQYE